MATDALGNPMEELLKVLVDMELDVAGANRLRAEADPACAVGPAVRQLAVGGQDRGAIQRPQADRRAPLASAMEGICPTRRRLVEEPRDAASSTPGADDSRHFKAGERWPPGGYWVCRVDLPAGTGDESS